MLEFLNDRTGSFNKDDFEYIFVNDDGLKYNTMSIILKWIVRWRLLISRVKFRVFSKNVRIQSIHILVFSHFKYVGIA